MDDLLSIGEGINSPLVQFVNFATNDCGYSDYEHDIMVSWFHPFF